MEIWVPITGYEGLYEVSDLGRIRGLERIVSTFSQRAGKVVPLRRKGKVLSQNSATTGYFTTCLCKNGGTKTHRVAALVCTAFHGQRPMGMQACHNDGCKANNREDNLRWDTPKNNQSDRLIHKTDCRGEAVGTAKFTAEQVSAIKSGMPAREATKLFGVSRSQYYRIRHGLSWAHVSTPAQHNVTFGGES